MDISISGWKKPVAAGLMCLLALPLAEVASAQASGAAQQQTTPASQAPTPTLETRDQSSQSGSSSSQQSSSQQQPGDQKPVGTAVAPVERSTGIAASRPAGAVIAPAKQKRARTILIRVGVVVGAAVAVGIVVGLSKASPARPNTTTAATP